MRYSLCSLALILTTLSSNFADSQEITVPPDVRDHIRFHNMENPDQSFTWNEGIEGGQFSIKSHVISPNDTYTSVIETFGIRADPNSIDLTRKLNEDRFPVKALPPNQNLYVISPVDNQQFVVTVHPILKAEINARAQELRSQRDAVDAWAAQHSTDRVAARARDLYHRLIENIQLLRVAGYALDRSALTSIDDALQEVEIVRTRLTTDRGVSSTEAQGFFSDVAEAFSSFVDAATNTDGSRIATEIITIDRKTSDEIDELNVCFKYALSLQTFRKRHPDREPNWSCDETFSTLSSPARGQFKQHLKYVIWAVDSTERVSKYEIISIKPNPGEDTFQHELAIDAS